MILVVSLDGPNCGIIDNDMNQSKVPRMEMESSHSTLIIVRVYMIFGIPNGPICKNSSPDDALSVTPVA